ncbi:ankyrin repeat-containing domain protein [Leptodontidium sp. MPI-SDFR-AT-0119]|nr:ankyrin repeat-containing domain protein [Leptodontidium sp. MPI-SDFR-AT-0119]
MADLKVDVSPERRLRGKVNFITWKREFEREAKAHDVLDLFTGDEEILDKPQKGNYLDDDDDKDSVTVASTQKALKNFHANTLRYTIDYNNWKSNRDSLRTANKLLNAWLSESIRIEIETAKNAKEAYDIVIARYKINQNSRTALWWAARNGHEAVIKLLLETGNADADATDEDGRTALWWAAGNEHEATLWWAARNGHEAVVKLLLETGKADADVKDIHNQTPLREAARNGHEAVVKLLLGTGKVDADVKSRNEEWWLWEEIVFDILSY